MTASVTHPGVACGPILTQNSSAVLKFKTPLGLNPMVSVPACFSSGAQGLGLHFWRITPARKTHVPFVHRNKQSDAADNGSGYFNRFVMFSGEGDGDVPVIDPQGKDNSKAAGLLGTFHRIQTAVHIFIVAFFWISLFFAASAWDGRNTGRHGKKDS